MSSKAMLCYCGLKTSKTEDYEALLDMLMDMDYHILIITN